MPNRLYRKEHKEFQCQCLIAYWVTTTQTCNAALSNICSVFFLYIWVHLSSKLWMNQVVNSDSFLQTIKNTKRQLFLGHWIIMTFRHCVCTLKHIKAICGHIFLLNFNNRCAYCHQCYIQWLSCTLIEW